MTNNKKSAPGGTQISEQDYISTSGSKSQWLAQILFEMIGKYDRPIKRPKNASVDRAFRQMIEHANMNGDCIINVGFGYYRPGDDDCVEFEEYVAKERHRARDILRKVRKMEEVYDRRYQ